MERWRVEKWPIREFERALRVPTGRNSPFIDKSHINVYYVSGVFALSVNSKNVIFRRQREYRRRLTLGLKDTSHCVPVHALFCARYRGNYATQSEPDSAGYSLPGVLCRKIEIGQRTRPRFRFHSSVTIARDNFDFRCYHFPTREQVRNVSECSAAARTVGIPK